MTKNNQNQQQYHQAEHAVESARINEDSHQLQQVQAQESAGQKNSSQQPR
ncbi:MAG TPA: hypothetical protein VEY51_16470 [Chondromyces sp.]|nr:hypothetical protein [Chondromyces sp.]